MTVLWNANAPLTSPEILRLSVDKSWRDASLHRILNNLLEKGAVAEHGFIKDGKSISRTFVPAISCEEYYKAVFSGHTSRDVPMILSALLSRSDFDAETIKKMEGIIRDRRAEAEK